MDQRQAFSNMQTSMSIGDTNDNALGGLVIVSALFTEFALTEFCLLKRTKLDEAAGIDGCNCCRIG